MRHRSGLHRGVRRVGRALAATAVAAAGVVGIIGPAVAPAAAVPGVPAAPTTIFTEGFENVADPAIAQLLNTYTGPPPTSMTYTAHPTWIDGPACNGVITSFNTLNSGGLCGVNYNQYARGGAQALSTVLGSGNDNHVLVDVTGSGTPAAPTPAATLQTVNPITLPGPNRFIAFSVDVAATQCGAAQPLLRFFLLDGATEIPLNVINPCTAPGGQTIVVSGLTWRVGQYATNSAVLFPGTQMGLKITNDQTSPGGNDYVIDNIQVLDATPALDKAFTPASVATGAPSTLTFTITNTSELGAKPGWSFTDNLPAGLAFAPAPNRSTTCTNGTITAAGPSSIQVAGDLDAGQTSCTASVDVVSSTPGSYTNGPANVINRVGINAPAQPATLTVGNVALQTCSAEEVRATQRYWYFGRQANIDFGVTGNTATPGLSPPTAGDVSEGSTVVTDTAGNLLFWSDGGTVFNRNSVPMPNGTSLLGAPSAEQTVVAFPSTVPGQYFIVTTNAVGNVDPLGTLYYSIVDMTLNGGLGDVTTKNVQLGVADTSGEGLAAIPNADGTGFWVLTYTPFQPTMLAYEFNGSGPVTGVAVESTLSTLNRHSFGSINVSPDLTQIALLASTDTGGGDAHILDFNAETGVATETLGWFVDGIPYSMDFSPSGDYVYVSRVFPGSLLRYRIEGAANGAAVVASRQTIGTLSGPGGAVRRGPDGKMYMANWGAAALAVVTNPDAAVPTFNPSGLPLAAGSLSRYGLPATVTGCAEAAPLPKARAAVVEMSTTWRLADGLPGAALPTFTYGARPLSPLMGDWDGNGTITVGTFQTGTFRLNNQNDSSAPELTFNFGDPRGYPVAGDFDGNGIDDVAVYKAGLWQIHYLGAGGPADTSFRLEAPFATGTYPNTIPVAGDWDGDGIDGIGTYDYATGTWVLKNRVGPGGPDVGPFVFWGGSDSYPVVGDFGGIGIDTPGYRVSSTNVWTARAEAVTSGATTTFTYGVVNSVPFTW